MPHVNSSPPYTPCTKHTPGDRVDADASSLNLGLRTQGSTLRSGLGFRVWGLGRTT